MNNYLNLPSRNGEVLAQRKSAGKEFFNCCGSLKHFGKSVQTEPRNNIISINENLNVFFIFIYDKVIH